jgi:hypothetical protein
MPTKSWGIEPDEMLYATIHIAPGLCNIETFNTIIIMYHPKFVSAASHHTSFLLAAQCFHGALK